MRAVIAEDSVLLREGIARLLADGGIEVVGQSGDGEDLLRKVRAHKPDIAIVDIRMPPTNTDEGIQLAADLRREHPDLGILVFSTYVEPDWVTRLLKDVPSSVGYLLKDQVRDAGALIDALRRVAAGSIALEPQVVAAMLTSARQAGPLALLSDQERRVLSLIAEGHSNEAIADRVGVSERTVESHVASIFRHLDLPAGPGTNRRVRAAVAFLDAQRR